MTFPGKGEYVGLWKDGKFIDSGEILWENGKSTRVEIQNGAVIYH
jgi:hypothetical protein